MSGFPGFHRPANNNPPPQQPPRPQQQEQYQQPQYQYQQPPQHQYQQPPQYAPPAYNGGYQQPPQMPQPGFNGGMPMGPPPGGFPGMPPAPQQQYQHQPPQGPPAQGFYGVPPPSLPPRNPTGQMPQQGAAPAYGPGSAPAQYTPNQVQYTEPLHHQYQQVPNSQNVPSAATNVAWVNGVPRLTGRKKALLIGINYVGQRGELRGCHADVNNIKRFIMEQYGFTESSETMVVLTDEPKHRGNEWLWPTRKSILAAINWLIQGAQPGDSLFLHYSGHGGQAKDLDGDEDDGYDETIYPVDHEKAGMIVDDELHALVAKLPAGANMTIIMDCCHSATVFDLPLIYMPDGSVKQGKTKAARVKSDAMGIGKMLLTKNKAGALMGAFKLVGNLAAAPNDDKVKRALDAKRTAARVLMMSGCKDNQTSADAHIDGKATGAMSYALLKSLRANPGQSYAQLLASTRAILSKEYSQIPQLSSGHEIDMNAVFVL
ncbi:hypothetical protein H9P43_001535 [Blastocladiella emersonii ATCC 22665]|nr:hypothetical protein H9P43_001535 [Blastocladiella emersonii ATCC 22665]